ncbi:helix-turn-helix transcriptional regulator [Candidatus Latescibacterota bacterium]
MKDSLQTTDINIRFYKIFKSTGLTQKIFGELVGLSQNQVSNIISGNRRITPMLAELLKTKLKINPKWLIENKNPMYIEKPTPEILIIPLFNNIPEGHWREWIDSSKMHMADSWITLPEELKGENYIALRVEDDSMEPLLHMGELFIIDLNKKNRDGLLVVRHHWGHKIRIVYKKSSRKYNLYPLKSKYKVEEITADKNTYFYVPVKVISVRDL